MCFNLSLLSFVFYCFSMPSSSQENRGITDEGLWNFDETAFKLESVKIIRLSHVKRSTKEHILV
jgi:hypothetical protein